MNQLRFNELKEIQSRKSDVDRLAQKYNIERWRMFDHCFTFISGCHMLIEHKDMDATMWRKFNEKLSDLFPYLFIEVYQVNSLRNLVDCRKITQEKMDEIMKDAKDIDDYFLP